MNSSQPPIRPLERRDAAACASLHRSSIRTGFLSSLGQGFLTQLYKAIISVPSAFGYVWEEDGRILGFVACTKDIGALYRRALLRRGPLLLIPLLRVLPRPSVIRQLWETLRYPAKTASDLPAAEVLSISVEAATRGKGIGKALLLFAFEEFRRLGIRQARIAVDAGNETANGLYRKVGFRLAMTRPHHGRTMNVYVVNLSR